MSITLSLTMDIEVPLDANISFDELSIEEQSHLIEEAIRLQKAKYDIAYYDELIEKLELMKEMNDAC